MRNDNYKADPDRPIYRYLDLSTSHTRTGELDVLLAITADARGPRTIAHKYGAWVNVPTESEAEAEEALEPILAECPHVAACLRYARAAHCTWINFDANAEQLQELAVFDWDHEADDDRATTIEATP